LWCGGDHLHEQCPEKGKYIFHLNMLQLSVSGRRKPPIQLQTPEGGDAEKEVAEDTQDYDEEGLTPDMSFAEEQQQPQTHQVAVAGPTTMEPRVPAALPNTNSRQQVSQFGPLM
jgi:hypothetical protein